MHSITLTTSKEFSLTISHLIFMAVPKASVLSKRNLRLWKANWVAQDHTANKWKTWIPPKILVGHICFSITSKLPLKSLFKKKKRHTQTIVILEIYWLLDVLLACCKHFIYIISCNPKQLYELDAIISYVLFIGEEIIA